MFPIVFLATATLFVPPTTAPADPVLEPVPVADAVYVSAVAETDPAPDSTCMVTGKAEYTYQTWEYTVLVGRCWWIDKIRTNPPEQRTKSKTLTTYLSKPSAGEEQAACDDLAKQWTDTGFDALKASLLAGTGCKGTIYYSYSNVVDRGLATLNFSAGVYNDVTVSLYNDDKCVCHRKN